MVLPAMVRRLLPTALLVCACVGGVGELDVESPPEQPTGADGGTTDAGDGGARESEDGGVPGEPDAGAAHDAGTDLPPSDAGPGTDAGATDAGPADAGACPALFCDDFEGWDAGAAPGAPWQVTLNKGTVAVSTTRAASGQKSVRVAVQAGVSGDSFRRAVLTLSGAPVLPVTGNNLFGRMRVWVNDLPSGDKNDNELVHYSFISGSGHSAAAGGTTLVKYGAMNFKRFLANYWEGPTKYDCWRNSATAMPEGRWSCLEWQFDGPRNEARLWLDGAALTDATILGMGDGCVGTTNQPWKFPVFDRLELGWQNYQLWSGQELWVDDVAIGTARIGCQ